jgi:hypothetical protein
LSYDQSDDRRYPLPSDSDKFTDYNDADEDLCSTPQATTRATRGGGSQKGWGRAGAGTGAGESDRYLLSVDEDSRRDDRASPPPPPFSIVTSSVTINDLKHAPPPPPPAAASDSSRLYRYSSFGDIDSANKSPQQQSVIQRIEAMKITKASS